MAKHTFTLWKLTKAQECANCPRIVRRGTKAVRRDDGLIFCHTCIPPKDVDHV